MKNLLLAFLMCLPLIANAQTITVTDAETKEPVPFATMLLKNNDSIAGGNYANESGVVTIGKELFTTAEFSCLGYTTKNFAKADIKETVLLQKSAIEMAGVTITKTYDPYKQKSEEVGYSKLKEDKMAAAKQGAEAVVFIANSYGVAKTIKSFVFKVKISKLYKSAFRIHFYYRRADGDGPGDEIVHEDIVQYVDKKSKSTVEVDVLPYNIELPVEGVYAGIEWLSSTGPNGALGAEDTNWYMTTLGYTAKENNSFTYYRYRLSDLVWRNVKNNYNATFGIKVLED